MSARRAFAGIGRGSATLVVSVDLLWSAGVRSAWQRLTQDAKARHLLQSARRGFYARIWREAANELEAEVVELGSGFLEIRGGGTTTRVREQYVPLDDIVAARLALDKTLVYRLLSGESIRIPSHIEVTCSQFDRAVEFLQGEANPCVVKPADGTGGGGATTAGVQSQRDLERALLRCSRKAERILVEEEIYGTVYRLLFLDGRLLGAVLRQPPRVRGDGRSTIRQLIAAENRRRLASEGEAGLDLIRVDLDSIILLARRGLRLGSVPREGELVAVKTVTSQNSIEDNETIHDLLAPELIEEAARAAEIVGVRLAGVDVVTPDPRVPLEQSGGIIIDVNAAPGLHHHYLVKDRPNHVRVAVPILRALLPAPGSELEQKVVLTGGLRS